MKTTKINSGRPTGSKTVAPPPSAKTGSKKTSTDRDSARMARSNRFGPLVQEISDLLADCDRSDRDMIRKNNKPFLDGFFDEDGKLRLTPAEKPSGNSLSVAA